jgi:DNA topoisomerase-2
VDAIHAGTARSKECTLVLTEGDSAKAFAVAGLAVLGHDKYGVFPLKGKLLNTREASAKQVMENVEIKALKSIIGLQHANAHANREGLRYGNVLILTDADADGSHIKGLFLNFMHVNWPELAKSGFVRTLPTPLVKATRGALSQAFFSMPELNAWLTEHRNGDGWRLKYYKGLGTWSSAEAKDIFRTTKAVRFLGDAGADAAMLLGFEAKQADARKAWIQSNTAEPPALAYTKDVTISDFVHKDLVNFSIYNVSRSIPSIVDGLKTSQRKVLFTVLDRKYTSAAREVKVAQLAGAVAERTLYLHGEQSLNDAIVNMAQCFAGANNVPLLHASGQFGTRLSNGADSASPRYIFTYAAALTRALFRPEDDALLAARSEEGVAVEPVVYYPVIPIVLVNGAAGISTGYSTSVPSFDPADVVANVERFLRDEPFQPMTPWYRGFTGTVELLGDDKFVVSGVARADGGGGGGAAHRAFLVTELPVGGKSFSDYADWLQDEKSPVKLLENRSTDTSCHFKVEFASAEAAAEAEAKGLLEVLKLKVTGSLRNMHLFDERGTIKKYASVLDVMAEWCASRAGVYERRRAHQLERLAVRAALLRSKLAFIGAVVGGEVDFRGTTEPALLELFERCGYARADGDGYGHLLNLTARSFTADRVQALEREALGVESETRLLETQSARDLWRADLKALREALG